MSIIDKPIKTSKEKFKSHNGKILFLFSLPFLCATFVFSYLPLLGWSYAFFDYRPGLKLFQCDFVGLKHFLAPFTNVVLRADMLRVLINTFAMSFLYLSSSILPLLFAVFIAEMKVTWYKKIVQTITTIPNFISWVLLYSLAYAMFSTNDGFLNHLAIDLGWRTQPINYLASGDHVWLTMWSYGVWKSLGWNSILYIASLSSIDMELYEAADIDGAGRFQKMRYITIPFLLPTFFTLLLLSVANLLNSGLDQYFLFQNAMNVEHIEVLDLYVYNKGLGVVNNISYATSIGMYKSIISVTLLLTINYMSKFIRGTSIF